MTTRILIGDVRERLGRDAILIELNATYAEMARRRIDEDVARRGMGLAATMEDGDVDEGSGAAVVGPPGYRDAADAGAAGEDAPEDPGRGVLP